MYKLLQKKMEIIACTFQLTVAFYNEDVGNVNL